MVVPSYFRKFFNYGLIFGLSSHNIRKLEFVRFLERLILKGQRRGWCGEVWRKRKTALEVEPERKEGGRGTAGAGGTARAKQPRERNRKARRRAAGGLGAVAFFKSLSVNLKNLFCKR